MSVNVAGFYHDPPIWVGESPIQPSSGPLTLQIDVSGGGVEPNIPFDRFADEVVRTTLTNGLEVSATLDGEFTFDFSAVPSCAYIESDNRGFSVIAETKIRRIRFMNAYLAFLYTREILAENCSRERMLVTMNLIFTKASKAPHMMFGPMLASRYPEINKISSFMAVTGRTGFVSTEIVTSAASDLSNLIENHGDDGVMLVDLYLRATHAFQEHNHSLSLVNYWTIIERMINELWKQLQDDHESRGGELFIDGKRRKRLEDGRTYTAAVMTEILSFLDYIPKNLYDDLSAVRKLRNDWMHDLRQIDATEAQRANSACERLLQQVMGVTLRGPGGLMLRGV